MCDNMLVNSSGNAGHAMGIDMNIEHLIRYLKASKSLLNKLNFDQTGSRACLLQRVYIWTGIDLVISQLV